ncbi:MAG: hypothetical protein V7K88_31650 [Nostoc sp.]|uniref:hypothetical protein n=1 Tax=Nostoc sp. TaxID=1180 RepID=UPI002FF491D3
MLQSWRTQKLFRRTQKLFRQTQKLFRQTQKLFRQTQKLFRQCLRLATPTHLLFRRVHNAPYETTRRVETYAGQIRDTLRGNYL